MTENRTIKNAFNLKFYRPKLWERIALFFVPLETHEQDGVVVTYKLFGQRLYVYSTRQNTYLLSERPNGGINKPWMN